MTTNMAAHLEHASYCFDVILHHFDKQHLPILPEAGKNDK